MVYDNATITAFKGDAARARDCQKKFYLEEFNNEEDLCNCYHLCYDPFHGRNAG